MCRRFTLLHSDPYVKLHMLGATTTALFPVGSGCLVPWLRFFLWARSRGGDTWRGMTLTQCKANTGTGDRSGTHRPSAVRCSRAHCSTTPALEPWCNRITYCFTLKTVSRNLKVLVIQGSKERVTNKTTLFLKQLSFLSWWHLVLYCKTVADQPEIFSSSYASSPRNELSLDCIRPPLRHTKCRVFLIFSFQSILIYPGTESALKKHSRLCLLVTRSDFSVSTESGCVWFFGLYEITRVPEVNTDAVYRVKFLCRRLAERKNMLLNTVYRYRVAVLRELNTTNADEVSGAPPSLFRKRTHGNVSTAYLPWVCQDDKKASKDGSLQHVTSLQLRN